MFKTISFQTDEEWREFRKQGIGGSEAGICLGVNPWRSPLELWLEKTGRAEPEDLSGKEAVEWGNRLEAAIAGKFADRHPEYEVVVSECTYYDEERPWRHANIDRALIERDTGAMGVLEVKTAGARSDKEWVFGPPDHYLAQVYWYLVVTGFEFAHICVLIGGQEYREYEVTPDREDMEELERAVDSFWNDFVLADVLPELKGTGDEARALATLYPEATEPEPVVTSDIDHPEIFERFQLAQDKKVLESRIKELDNKIKALIGSRERVNTESTSVKWSRYTRESVDSKRLKAERPDIWAEYATETETGRLTFSAAKE